jgi:hypothetical protein
MHQVFGLGLRCGAALFVVAAASLTPAAELFPTGSQWKYFKGRSEASTPEVAAWRAPGFDDSPWVTGRTPIYYGEQVSGTALSEMRGNYTSVFLRRTFTIAEPIAVTQLVLGAICDDGFIAWINGHEVVRYNVPEGDLPFNATATTALTEPLPFEEYVISNPEDFLLAGENVLAVQAFNVSLSGSTDFLFNASLEVVFDEAPPRVEEIIPPAGSTVRELAAIEVRFNEPVRGLETEDLLVNGAAATNVIEVAPGQFLFTFPPPADGEVAVAWRAEHAITDRLGAAHPFAGGAWSYRLDTTSPAPGVIISEFMADNRRTLHDEDGDDSDWIELFNGGETTASLKGWFLTDVRTNLAKWQFPDVALPPNGFLVVFASQKDKTLSTGRLHTNFKLATEGEYLALVSPDTNIVSEFTPTYPQQFTDISYGRVRGAPQSHGYFTKPTPGAPNEVSGPGFAPEVSFSRASGTFTAPFELRLTTPVAGTVVRYTLDGNLPTNSSPAYLDPIRITNSLQVRARVYQEGLLPGPVRTESYVMLHSNVVSFTSDLPVIILHTMGKGTPNSSRQTFSHFAVFEPVKGVTSLTNRPTLVARSGLKLRGSSTEGLAKSSFAVEFWDEFNLDLDLEILGMPADSDWVLYAPNQYEPIMIHNPFIHQLSRDMGRYSPRTRFVEVYLAKTPGPVGTNQYNGIYVLEEKIKVGQDRVDAGKLEPEHLQPPEITGGYLLKIDRLDPGDGGFNAGGVSMAYVDPKEREIELPQRDPQEQYIKNYFNEFNKALNSTNWLDPVLGYAAYIDVDAWIDYHVLEVLSGNVDALVLSTYFHKPRNGKLVFGPHWDFDRALGSTDGRDSNPRNWGTGPYFSWWYQRLCRDKDFWQKWIDRYEELRLSHFSTANLHGLIDRLVGEIQNAQPREKAKWRLPYRGGTWQGEVNHMRNWISNRVDYFDQQFARPPRLSADGGRINAGFTLSLTGPTNATVYYTLDGSDPRLPQGGVAPQAQAYTGPLTLNANARVVARSHNPSQRQNGPPISSPWSGPVAATFVVTPPPLVVTEIMFHPTVPAGSTSRPSDFEFIELKNVGAVSVDLAGFHFNDGIQFRFTSTSAVASLAPGARVVLAKNLTAFKERYPGVVHAVGDYTGSLSEGGERLRLFGPLEEPVVDFVFEDDWYPLADGHGFSLVLRDETTPAHLLGLNASWRLSVELGGSPGQPDPSPGAIAPVLVNEALTHTDPPELDAIELFNPLGVETDVSGWFLTDDFREPAKYCLPAGSRLAARGFLVVREDKFRPTLDSGFALSSLGDEVYLFSADAAGNLTGWFHGFEFGAAQNGVSFGRVLDEFGGEHFVAQQAVTLDAPNAGPKVGPVVINELLYEPAPAGGYNNTNDEFVELLNTSPLPVPLFDPLHPANTWRLRGGIEFDFPPQLSLPGNGFLVVVSFDPRSDLAALHSFRAQFGLDTDTPIVGPWRGALNNAGDRVRLLKPDPPQLPPAPDAGLVPYVLVEQVDYSPAPPWPSQAAGTGWALQRFDTAHFSADPGNWLAGPPSPGDLDADSDGLPDRWEVAHRLAPASAAGADGPGADPDGDGATNLQEYYAGTDPRDPASALRLAVAPGADGVRLRFVAVPDKSYTVLYRERLATGAWQVLRSVLPQAEPSVIELTEPAAATTRFYRVQTP